MEKRRYIAAAVTTVQALKACLEEQAVLFCIENPLYSELKGKGWTTWDLSDYEITDYTDKQVLILKKVRGESVFDDEIYIPFYLPLSWEGWHS